MTEGQSIISSDLRGAVTLKAGTLLLNRDSDFYYYPVYSQFYRGGSGYATKLCMQIDGNLVLYANTTVLWSSGTSGSNLIFALLNWSHPGIYQDVVSPNTLVYSVPFIGN